MKRPAISKSLRFNVFSRDRYTCRYCGRCSDEVKLVIDHIIPVAAGGGNNEENLVTACEACNQGKSAKPAIPNRDAEVERLRAQQELQEQKSLAERARELSEARAELRQEVVDFWCEQRSCDSVSKSVLGVLMSFVEQHGIESVFRWIEIMAQKGIGSERNAIRYLCGIRRNEINLEVEDEFAGTEVSDGGF